jgi:hypothetical protein
MAAKGNGKSDVFHHTLTHLRGPPVVLVRTLRVEPDGSTNQRSSAANTVPAVQSASQITKSNLRNGGLVFFYRGIGHVGLYADNGKVLHAPRPGKKVSYIKMSHMPYRGARRPG